MMTIMNKWKIIAWSIEWEGSIFLTKNGNKKAKQGFCINARLSIVCKNRILLEQFQKMIKYGGILPHWNHKTNRQYWQFRIVKRDDLIKVLPNIIPYLITKKEKAKIVLEWCKSRELTRGSYTNEELQIFNKYLECVKNPIY